MQDTRLLLCTDMDRTIIPNGSQSEDSMARKLFAEFCRRPEVTLVYVTGRHKRLVIQAIKNYQLPEPDFAITDVGTMIYQVNAGAWQEYSVWSSEIDIDWNGRDHGFLKNLLGPFTELKLQEIDKQNKHKLSYYVSLYVNHESLVKRVKDTLSDADIHASVIWSIDEPKGIGLLDILPEHATKLHAIDFLRQQLNYSLNDVVFAGDSGNDLPVIASAIPSVLVANASADVISSAHNLVGDNADALYIATGANTKMNGNYSAGVLEGICHYMPYFRAVLTKEGFYCD